MDTVFLNEKECIGKTGGSRELLVHAMAEQPRRQSEVNDCDDSHGPVLRPEKEDGAALEENGSEDHQEIAHRIHQGEVLDRLRHVRDRRGKAGKNNRGDQKEVYFKAFS